MTLVVGDRSKTFTGDVTTLNWIGPRPRSDIERNVGYGPGRLAAGYWVLLLVEYLTPEDFEFSGTTLRSGGRLGLPAKTPALDTLRPRVHDRIAAERGADGYRNLQKQVLRSIASVGPNRIAKVLPEDRLNRPARPNEDYPMGAGSLQWTLVPPGKRFLVAMHVSADGTATTPRFSVSLAENQPGHVLYDNRAKISRYLANVV